MKIEIKRKLSLNKETIAKINEEQMKAIAGGAVRLVATNQQQTDLGLGKVANFAANSDCCSKEASSCC